MLSQRPFKDADEVFESAERIWWDLKREDWLEAFAAHPRIGGTDGPPDGRTDPRAREWAAKEQSSVANASAEVKAQLARANADYEKRFGWIYIVCATGKSPEEMLALCRARLANEPDAELKIAAAEQARITRLRLEQLLAR